MTKIIWTAAAISLLRVFNGLMLLVSAEPVAIWGEIGNFTAVAIIFWAFIQVYQNSKEVNKQ